MLLFLLCLFVFSLLQRVGLRFSVIPPFWKKDRNVTGNFVTLIQTECDSFSIAIVSSFFWLTFEIGVAEKFTFCWDRKGNVRADGDLIKRSIYDLSELFCAPQARYKKWCGDQLQDTADMFANQLTSAVSCRILRTSTGYYTTTHGTVVRTNNN